MKLSQAGYWLWSRAPYGLLGIFLAALLQFSTHVSPQTSPAPQGMLAFKTRHFTFYYPDNIPKPAIRDILAFAEGVELAYQRFVLKWGFRDWQHTWTIKVNT
ncbi:MAG: hypothetical protein K6T71_07410, partial [Candidatus Bipolaricaulota bacterium]|nr:hypothetical protein [Candidatus Bipolaricaulota bacterium]